MERFILWKATRNCIFVSIREKSSLPAKFAWSTNLTKTTLGCEDLAKLTVLSTIGSVNSQRTRPQSLPPILNNLSLPGQLELTDVDSGFFHLRIRSLIPRENLKY